MTVSDGRVSIWISFNFWLSSLLFKRDSCNALLYFVSASKIHTSIGEGQWLSMEVLYVVYQNNMYENSCGTETLSKVYDFAKANAWRNATAKACGVNTHLCSSINKSHAVEPVFFRAHLLFATFAIWTPFAENTWLRNFQYRFFFNRFIAFFSCFFFGYFLSCAFTAFCPFAKNKCSRKLWLVSRTIDAREKYTF